MLGFLAEAPMSLSRRVFIGGVLASSACWPFVLRAQPASGRRRTFQHGVASGDPLPDGVLLWTRVTPASEREVEVRWQIARDARMQQLVARGSQPASGERDFTVKIDTRGLAPGTTYYYQFEALGTRSPIGRTKTLPVGAVGHARFAVASCSNYPWGYFNAYRRIAERSDLDMVLHLGDYFYEYKNGQYGDGTRLGRIPSPDHEVVSLADYRIRHAQYKTDPDLQEAHRQHPFVTVWDDHEIANNTWAGGAENHDPDQGEGEWEVRKAAAARAYSEWMPIRDHSMTRQIEIYRSFAFGDLIDLVMLDTRLVGRDEEAKRTDVDAIASPARTLLGPAQEAWLTGELLASKRANTRWRVLGQQVMMGHLRHADGGIRNPDQWDGYRASRERLFDVMARERVDNMVVLTGDIHSSWALDVAPDPFSRAAYDPDTGRGAVAVEYVTPAITSPGTYSRNPEKADGERDKVLAQHPHIKFLDAVYRGYCVLDITQERAQAEWYFVPTVDEQTREERFAKAFATAAGTSHVVEVAQPAPTSNSANRLAPRED